ncbi:MAG: hypothetical protein Q7R40_09160 [Phaeospirillum sp.]|nr:hypothetical protein [Phaeospirillum sp.]
MVADRASFEVQVSKDGRWSTETIVYKEDEARTLAKKLLADKKCEGAKIVRNWLRSDGTMVETEVFCETRAVKDDGPIRITPIDSVPAEKCETPEEFLGPDARGVMNRVFRTYLDKAFLTPTELMHSYKELKRLQEKDSLVPSAVDRVAQLQTKDGEQAPKDRSQEIFKSIDNISARARRVESLKLPKLDGRFSDVIAKLGAMGESEDRDYLAMVVLSRDLINVRNWVGKLERLCALAVEDSDPHAVEMLDGVIADVLGSNVVQDVLGWQPGLGAAIIAMFDLADGKMPPVKSDAGESAEVLNRLFAEKKLPISRNVLLDRAHRQIRSPNPLMRNDTTKEFEEFKRLIGRALCPTGFVCGSETADAVTARYTRMVEQGGAAGRKAAIEGVFRALPDPATGLVYLCELAGSSFAAEHTPDIMETMELVFRCRSISDLCLRTLPPKERMLRATNAHRVAMASVLPPELKTKVADFIDTILERYLIDEQIVEKLDHHDSPLRDRAVRLVQFCAAGVLPEGKAMTRARQRILMLLRQPNFDAHFIDGFTDPMRAQKALRDFHQLLVKAGFG